jgi:hypothetical protein
MRLSQKSLPTKSPRLYKGLDLPVGFATRLPAPLATRKMGCGSSPSGTPDPILG